MKTAKLFKHGNNQAVCLPKEFHFEGSEVLIKHAGGAVVLLPKSWDMLLSSLDQFSNDFMERCEQPMLQDRENLSESLRLDD